MGQDGSIEFEMVQISPSAVCNYLGAWQEFPQGLMGQWWRHYTSKGQDSSIELEMAIIGAAVMKLQHLQNVGAWREFPQEPDRPMIMPLHI